MLWNKCSFLIKRILFPTKLDKRIKHLKKVVNKYQGDLIELGMYLDDSGIWLAYDELEKKIERIKLLISNLECKRNKNYA